MKVHNNKEVGRSKAVLLIKSFFKSLVIVIVLSAVIFGSIKLAKVIDKYVKEGTDRADNARRSIIKPEYIPSDISLEEIQRAAGRTGEAQDALSQSFNKLFGNKD